MPTILRTSLVLVLSATLLGACGGDTDDSPVAKASEGCTERDGAWFGKRADGAMITSQTRDACEERIRE